MILWIRMAQILILASAVSAGGLEGQGSERDGLTAVLTRLREHGNSSSAAAWLAQEGGRRSPQELEVLADSLVSIAVGYRTGDPPEKQRAASDAALAILVAAHPGHLASRAEKLAEAGQSPPVPFARAFDHLVRVFEGTNDAGMRGGVLYLLTQLPHQGRVATYLAGVAASPSPAAHTAIRHLGHDMGEPGLAALRRLHQTGAVSEPTAREYLEIIARARGWTR
jgi:hypothetical protein